MWFSTQCTLSTSRIPIYPSCTSSHIQIDYIHSYTLSLPEYGHLYMWGSGSEGQLGLGMAESELPTLLKFRSKVIHVACGYYHTAVITGTMHFFFSILNTVFFGINALVRMNASTQIDAFLIW